MSVTDISGIIADKALNDWAARLGTKTVMTAAKAGALATKRDEPGPSDDFGYGIIDFNAHPELKGTGFKSYLLAPKVYQDAPELFYGPFLQLGTYLKESGVIDSETTKWALDLLVPGPAEIATYAFGGAAAKGAGLATEAAGKGLAKVGAEKAGQFLATKVAPRVADLGITAAGKSQRLLGQLAEGSVGLTGEQIVEKAHGILETAGRLVGASDELVKAAQAGEKGALRTLLSDVTKTGVMDEGYRAVTEAMLRDKKALGSVLDEVGNFRKTMLQKTLGPRDVLQDTLRGRLEQGAVRGTGLPALVNPFKQPLVFSQQMLGFGSHDQRLWFPGGSAIAAGLEKVAPEAFEIAGRRALTAEASLKGAIETGDFFAKPSVFRPRITSWQNAVGHEALLAINSAPNQRIFKTVGYADIEEGTLKDAFRSLHGLSPRTDIDPEKFGRFIEDVVGDANEARAAVDKYAIQRQDEVIQTMVGRIADVAGQAEREGKLKAGSVEALTAQARRIFQTLRRVDTLRYESQSLGSALAGRANVGSLLAHIQNVNMREIVEGQYKGSGAREAIREVIGYAAAYPKLFDDAGKLIATREEITAAGAHFLDDLLTRSANTPSMAFLEKHLRTEGLRPEVWAITKQMRDGLDGVGANLQAEGVIQGMLKEYFPRAISLTDKGLAEFKLLHSQTGEWFGGQMEKALGGGSGVDDRIATLLDEADFKSFAQKHRQGVLSMQETRRFTEKFAQAMERRKWAVYERDAPTLYAKYMESANKALLWNRIALNPEALAPHLTMEAIRSQMGDKIAEELTQRGIDNAWLLEHDVRHMMQAEKVPGPIGHIFEKLKSQPREGTVAGDTEAVIKFAAGKGDKRLAADAEERVLAKIDGQSSLPLSVDGKTYKMRLRDKAGKPVKFDPSWHTTGKYPETIRNWKSVKEAVKQAVADEINRTSAAGEKLVAQAGERVAGAKMREVAVFRPHFGHLSEAFGLIKSGQVNNAFTRVMDRWNYRLKSSLLGLDVFHYNVLAFSGFAADPTIPFKMLVDEAGKFLPGVAEGGFLNTVRESPALRKAAIGATLAGGVAAVSGRDEKDIIAFSIAGAVYGASIAAAMRNSREGFRLLVSPDHLDTLLYMGLGGWSGRPDDRAIGIVSRSLKSIRNDLARDPKGFGALVSPIDKLIHIGDGWDRQLWDVLQNGSKHYMFATRWASHMERLEKDATFLAADDAGKEAIKLGIAKQLVEFTNNAMGGKTWRYMLDRPETQHTLRYILLSPDWTSSRIAGAANVFLNMKTPQRMALGAALGTATDLVQYGADTDSPRWRGPILGALMGAGLGKLADGVQRRMMVQGDVLAKESRRLWTSALVMGYLTMEAMNIALSGHHMFENPEGKKTSIDLGDGSYLSLGKPWVEPLEFAGIYKAKEYPIPIASRLKSKAAVLPLAAINILSNSDGFGPLITVKDSAGEVAYKLADFAINLGFPIAAQGPSRLGAEMLTGTTSQGSLERALLRGGGFSTTTIPNRAPPPVGLPAGLWQTLGPPSLGDPSGLLSSKF